MLFFGAIAAAAIGGFVYVKGLQKDLAVAKENMIKMEQAHKAQQKVIEQQKIDFQTIVDTNKQINDTNKLLLKEFSELDKKFNKINASGKKRDIGALGVKKPRLIEKIINKGTTNAQRCIEIASGAKLTEKEINAKKKSEINPECSNIANPNYIPYN